MRHPLSFRPQPTNSTTLSVTASSDRVGIPGSPSQVRLSTNGTDSVCFIEFGDSNVTAVSTGTSMRLGPGAIEVFSVPLNATHIAAKTASGTATLYITPGEGA
jgi:hypothetical protein